MPVKKSIRKMNRCCSQGRVPISQDESVAIVWVDLVCDKELASLWEREWDGQERV
jgi:hypothetical protein